MTNTTALAASVRITVACTFCARRFDALLGFNTPGPLTPACDDEDGRSCCDDCICAHCGRGHYTEDEAVDCETNDRFPSGENVVPTFEYSAWSDARQYPLCVER